jgi:hypothetical protein
MSPDLLDHERAAVGAMWAFRAAAEHETAAQYRGLAARLRSSGVADAVVEGVSTAAVDEARHSGLCAELAERAGCRPAALPAAVALPRIAPHQLNGRARLAYEMAALFCVTESINATLLLRSWERSEEQATRAVLRALLADEVKHSRIGWGYLASAGHLGGELASRLPLMLAAATHHEPFLVEAAPLTHSPALAAHGMLSQHDLRAVFLEAMNDVILPGLEHCGVPTAEARRWLHHCTARWPGIPYGQGSKQS